MNKFKPLILAIIPCLLLFTNTRAQDATTLQRDLPIDEIFEAGSRVTFTIDHEDHTEIHYSNVSDVDVTTVYHVFKDGEALPEGKIAPVKYRTRELDPGETLTMVYNWENGYEIIIEINQGKMQVLVGPES